MVAIEEGSTKGSNLMATQSIRRAGEALATSSEKAAPVGMAGVLSILSVAVALLAAVAAATGLLAPSVYRDGQRGPRLSSPMRHLESGITEPFSPRSLV